MNYKEFSPGNALKDYVKCYFICESESMMLAEDKVFATGFVEVMFNLGEYEPQTLLINEQVSKPLIQFWGQIVQPLTIKSVGRHSMFGIRFFAHTASCFLNESIEQFNNHVFDFKDVAGSSAGLLQSRLAETVLLSRRIELVEAFLLQRLSLFERKPNKIRLVNNVMQEITQDDFFENINNVAARYGISSRYLQKIFLQYAGLTPNLFNKINRFQKSLQLIAKAELPLTAIAYKCGYFDQSHFIKDFKSFTGVTPSSFKPESSTEFLALRNN